MKKISRRHVIVTLASTATFLCPAVLNAATTADLSGWANIPTDIPMGLKQVLRLENGPASIDISQLKPGDVLIHDSFIVHGSKQNLSKKDRIGLTIRYIEKKGKIDQFRKKIYEKKLNQQIRIFRNV